MSAWSLVFVPIVVALIGGPLMWALKRLDDDNTRQHSEGQREAERRHLEALSAISKVDTKVDKVETTVSKLADKHHDHIKWHLTKKED